MIALEGNVVELTELLNTWKNDSVVNEGDTIGTTALHSAASHGHVSCVKALLLAGANKNAKNHVSKLSSYS